MKLRLALFFTMLVTLSLGFAQYGYLVIGTGSPNGIYLPVGSAVSRIVNAADVGTRATLFTTDGSVENLRGLLFQDYNLAVVQADVAYRAVHGEGIYADNPLPELRALIGLHQEPLHLLCRSDAEVTTFAELTGKRVNIGNEGSGENNTVQSIFTAADIALESLQVSNYGIQDAVAMLQQGTLDCLFYSVGIGSETLQYLARTTDITIVPLEGDIFDTLVATTPYYIYTTIPAHSYAGIDEDIRTFGTHAILVTTDNYPTGIIYRITQALIANLDTLQAGHPALSTLNESNYLDTTIELHRGAAMAFAEAGLAR